MIESYDLFRGYGVPVLLKDDDAFLKVRETLTRIGIASKKEKKLWASCLPRNSIIQTEDGEKTIKEIVDSKYTGKVLSYNFEKNEFEYNNIVSHMVKPNIDKKWVVLKTSNFSSAKRLVCTDDHLVAVVSDCFNPKIEYVEAKDSLGRFLVRNAVRNSNMMFNVSVLFNKNQLSALIGTVLGDSCIAKAGGIQIAHSINQMEYIKNKCSLFGGVLSEPKSNKGFSNGNHKIIVCHVKSNEQTKQLRKLLYSDGKKSIKNILHLIDEISLAYWYMDDGHITSEKNFKYAMLNTQGFSYDDHILLKEMFNNKFGLDPSIDKYKMSYKDETKEYYRLRFKKEDSDKFFNIISPYIDNSMRYKLPEEFLENEVTQLDNKPLSFALKPILELNYVSRTYNKEYLSSKLYDIEVENVHNFVANDSVVHNCNILHKQGFYHILHFKELFLLDGRESDLSENDLARRNTIAFLLDDWGLLTVLDKPKFELDMVDMSQIKVLSYKEKGEWTLMQKYSIGNRKNYNSGNK